MGGWTIGLTLIYMQEIFGCSFTHAKAVSKPLTKRGLRKADD